MSAVFFKWSLISTQKVRVFRSCVVVFLQRFLGISYGLFRFHIHFHFQFFV